MCGISGTYGTANQEIARAMIEAIKHRGPDQLPILFRSGDNISAACRLSIVDLQGAGQPFLNRAKNICLTLNGEIYNYLDIRKHLQNKGYNFITKGDIEVILFAYEEYGIKFMDYLQGMFAISLYDSRIDTLFLIRDEIGIKPLYYMWSPSFVAYSSEIKSFFAAGLSSGEIDEDYLCHRFVFNFGPIDKTLFRDIVPIEPGSYLEIRKDGEKLSCVSSRFSTVLKKSPKNISGPQQEIRRLLVDSVELMIPKEVPWGIFLSGGIDSSILAYIASKSNDLSQKLFTIADETETDDIKNARTIAKFLDVDLIELRVSTPETIEMLPNYLLSMEEFDPYSMFWYVLAKGASPYIKVALCGQGADELFGGYPFYQNIRKYIAVFYARFLSIESKVSLDAQQSTKVQFQKLMTGNVTQNFYRLFLKEQLVGFQLMPVDKCTMASGLEARVPYLTESILQYVSNLPLPKILNDNLVDKRLLRTAFYDSNLPNLHRRKQFSGLSTLPNYYKAMDSIADKLDGKGRWENHPYKNYMKNKIEMMGFDLLMFLLRERQGKVPINFRFEDLY